MKLKLFSRIFVALACVTLLCGVLVGCGEDDNAATEEDNGTVAASEYDSTTEDAATEDADTQDEDTVVDTDDTANGYIGSVSPDNKYGSGIHHAEVTVEDYDPFTIELDADDAPVTVANFCSLANDKFYDGLTFHRIVEDFCLQGGDPDGNGTGGSDHEILGEFSDNDVDNPLADKYQRGTVAMARSSDPNSASSQFFITLDDSAASSLDGQYAAFGTVDDEGMKVVDQIVTDYIGNTDAANSGTIDDIGDQPLIKSITITD
ncbi:MAG: peptidylprolyl isomerase [Coriobacteriaceae bacterium]|nr:peptidylprolyl isomerase [Coriobacteriaceae bacterium]